MVFLFAILYNAMLPQHFVVWTNEKLLFRSGNSSHAKPCSVYSLEDTWYSRESSYTDLYAMCFHTLKKDVLEYVQCGYTQWCMLPEVFDGNVLI